MNGKILLSRKVVIPWFNEFPYKETRQWGKAYRAKLPDTRQAALKAVPDPKTFRKRMAKPIIDSVQRMLRDDFVSRKGLTKKQIISRMKKELNAPTTAQKYRNGIKQGFKTLDRVGLNRAMAEYQLGQTFGAYRFRAAIESVLEWMTGIIQPKKLGKFRAELGNQLLSSGILISKMMYAPDIIQGENDKVNRLINKYIRKVIIPFQTGGPSHCDFVVIPASVTSVDSTKVKEIEYKIYSSHLGKKKADYLRRTSIEKDYSATPPNPDDYRPGKPGPEAYFDMELDIQITGLL
ncbi:hypothetical protein HY772_06165, partial [Candidatus Woesearchaeota archaeon]|nr:hypothetical protein [Candidatus Woesearchaeota archaeon]